MVSNSVDINGTNHVIEIPLLNSSQFTVWSNCINEQTQRTQNNNKFVGVLQQHKMVPIFLPGKYKEIEIFRVFERFNTFSQQC